MLLCALKLPQIGLKATDLATRVLNFTTERVRLHGCLVRPLRKLMDGANEKEAGPANEVLECR